VSEKAEGFFVKGTHEDAITRIQGAFARLAKERVERTDSPDWEAMADFFESLHDESDRAIPVLAFAYVDVEMSRLLKSSLNRSVEGGLTRLFGPLGPLGSASARINLAHALHWLSDETAHDLHVLRKIRNRFAHQLVDKGLRDRQTIDDLVEHRLLIRVLEQGVPDMTEVFEDSALDMRVLIPLRDHLIGAAALTTVRALTEPYVLPSASSVGVEPYVLLNPESDNAPIGVSSQQRTVRRLLKTLIFEPIDARVKEIVAQADGLEEE
jgi:DNA-binding MltR family transcriptional regulator